MTPRSYVFGFTTPSQLLWLMSMNDMIAKRKARILLLVLRGVLFYLLPRVWYKRGQNCGASWLGVHFTIVSGPYVCAFCGRATGEGGGSRIERGQARANVPPHCSRRACFTKALAVDEPAENGEAA